MYTHEKTDCGCGGASRLTGHAHPTLSGRKALGHIDSSGQCVCGECEPCDGLQCLCRPRYFDGQLLTAADFRRLDSYITAKHRLHNKYLHGVGVVCGLEAVCSPCDDTVTVRTGYALGPCGEDIVVSQDARVDVAALVKDYRATRTVADCSPYSEPRKDSEAARQKWVLGICYGERPARPVAGLKRAGSGCRCGGSCGGSCDGSCGGSAGGSGGTGGSSGSCGGSCSPPATGPASCEPTQVCEGYQFTLTKLPPRQPERGSLVELASSGELPQLVMACLVRLRDGLTQLPDDPSEDELIGYALDLKEELRELVETGNVHDCTLGRRLFDITIPDAGDEGATDQARKAIAAMLQVAVDLFRDCVCSALLPPCATGCTDECVPLAVVTVRSSDLRVLDICNWSARKFAITMPTLSYWLGWIPIFGALRDAIVRLCCADTRRPQFEIDDNLKFRAAVGREAGMATGDDGGVAGDGGAVSPRIAEPASFVALAEQFRHTWSSLSGVEATVLGALGARTSEDQPLASALELDHPLTALTLGRLGVGAGASLLPPGFATRFAEETGPAASDDRIADLEATIAKLGKRVETQARDIRTLKSRRNQ